MYKNTATGQWEHDFRVDGLPRWHPSYGTRKADAERLHDVAKAVWKSKDRAVIEALKARRVTLEQLAQARELGKPFMTTLDASVTVKPWPTLQEAADAYVEGIKANSNRAAGTAKAAETQLRKAVGFIGADVRLDAITTERVTAYQTFLRTEGRSPTQGASTNTVTAYVWRIGALYRWHLRREAIAAREGNRPARALHVPIDSEVIGTDKTARGHHLTEADAASLLQAAPPMFRAAVGLGLFAGLRRDEMCHLRPSDINFERDTLSIRVQPHWKPKTKRSVRHIAIARTLRPILEAHIARWSNDFWLLPSLDDPALPFNAHTFDTHFPRIVETAELAVGRKHDNGVTYHTLRHTFASWLIMRGADLFTVAQLLGNTVAQVEKTYGHLSKDHRQAAVDRLADAFPMPDLSR